MTAEQGLAPVAQGGFAQTPFAHILVYLHVKQMSGTLEVNDAQHSATIYFRDGAPAKMVSSFEEKSLGQVLIDLKLINEAQLRTCRKEIGAGGGLEEEILLRQGAIDARAMVRGLREQLLHKILDVFTMPEGKYAFYDKVNLLVGRGADEVFRLDPYPLLLAAMRVHGERLNVGAVLAGLSGRWISVQAIEPLKRFGLTKAEREVCGDLMSGPASYDMYMKSNRHDRHVTESVLYTLLITKELKVDEEPPATDNEEDGARASVILETFAPVPVAAEESLSAEALAFRRAVQDKAAAIASQNYFEMLGVSTTASYEDVRKAYFHLAKEFHPDRAVGPERQDLRDILDYIFSNLAEANATLVDADAREGYERSLGEGKKGSPEGESADEAEVRTILEAENTFQKALVLLRRGQIGEAKELVNKARELAPKEAEYLATQLYIEAQERPLDAKVDDLIDRLRTALDDSPRSASIHLFMGQLLKRSGRPAEAKSHFQAVLDVNPNNIEAARAIHLVDRKDGTPAMGRATVSPTWKPSKQTPGSRKRNAAIIAVCSALIIGSVAYFFFQTTIGERVDTCETRCSADDACMRAMTGAKMAVYGETRTNPSLCGRICIDLRNKLREGAKKARSEGRDPFAHPCFPPQK
ncbi:MAG: DnaJ domain-containing protein [Deltaproteobacteria bacterium]|nr:DnaJ domain-containing protein [Deltaproteobacteria bacterium]